MRKKRSIRDILNDLDEIKKYHPNNKASLELFAKIQAKRKEEGYISEYDCLLELGVIDEVVVPKGAVNLFPYMKQKHMLVKEALKDPAVKEQVEALQNKGRVH